LAGGGREKAVCCPIFCGFSEGQKGKFWRGVRGFMGGGGRGKSFRGPRHSRWLSELRGNRDPGRRVGGHGGGRGGGGRSIAPGRFPNPPRCDREKKALPPGANRGGAYRRAHVKVFGRGPGKGGGGGPQTGGDIPLGWGWGGGGARGLFFFVVFGNPLGPRGGGKRSTTYTKNGQKNQHPRGPLGGGRGGGGAGFRVSRGGGGRAAVRNILLCRFGGGGTGWEMSGRAQKNGARPRQRTPNGKHWVGRGAHGFSPLGGGGDPPGLFSWRAPTGAGGHGGAAFNGDSPRGGKRGHLGEGQRGTAIVAGLGGKISAAVGPGGGKGGARQTFHSPAAIGPKSGVDGNKTFERLRGGPFFRGWAGFLGPRGKRFIQGGAGYFKRPGGGPSSAGASFPPDWGGRGASGGRVTPRKGWHGGFLGAGAGGAGGKMTGPNCLRAGGARWDFGGGGARAVRRGALASLLGTNKGEPSDWGGAWYFGRDSFVGEPDLRISKPGKNIKTSQGWGTRGDDLGVRRRQKKNRGRGREWRFLGRGGCLGAHRGD